jgi:hypothetical protein
VHITIVIVIATAYRLASLRFLQPRHWCVECLADGGGYGREWELAQRELCRLVEVTTDSYKTLLSPVSVIGSNAYQRAEV